MKKTWIILSMIFLLSLPVIHAFSGSSANYILQDASIGLGSGEGSSASYNVRYSMPEQPVGNFTSTSYNLCLGHYYLEPPKADIQVDCEVNILDLIVVGNAFGSTSGDPNWKPAADLKPDGKINVLDLSIIGKNFGNSCWERCSG